MNSRNCEICNDVVHWASYLKYLRSKKLLEKVKQNEMIIPDWSYQELVENKIKKIYNPRSLKQIARDNVRLDNKRLNKELAKEMITPYYFIDRNLRVGFKFILDSQHVNHVISKLTITSNFPEFGIEVRYINKITKELSVFYARIKNQYKFKHQTVFSARFD